jgi:kynureninase
MSAADFGNDLATAQELDAADTLARFRRRFHLPRGHGGKPARYLCGHSLGLMPKTARSRIERELDRWQARGVNGHFDRNDGWYRFHERFRAPLAKLAGARESEVVAMNSLTVNLHLMLVSFYRPTRKRHKILIERGAFPSDRYAVASQIRFHGFDPARALIELTPYETGGLIHTRALEDVLVTHGEEIALVLLPGVQYLSGQALPIDRLAAIAHRYGCRIGFDLAHAIGNTRLAMHRTNADFAVWCSYKYLNGGPGAIGGCFVHERHADIDDLPRFAGWWGSDPERRFLMEEGIRWSPGADAWQISNPPIFSMAPLAASLEIFMEAGLRPLREKSQRLTAYLERLLGTELGDSIEILTPPAAGSRGAQISVRLLDPSRRSTAIAARLNRIGVVVDSREPDVLRLTPTPLYNRFRDVYEAVKALKASLKE